MPGVSSTLPPLDRSPKANWVEHAGGLPPYIDKIARRIHANGVPISTAIATAIAAVKRWATGQGNVNADTRAKAAAAVAQWEKMKLATAAKRGARAVGRAATKKAEDSIVAYVDGSGEVFRIYPDAEKVDKGAPSYHAETRKIRSARRRVGDSPHQFSAARWTHRTGGARCRLCGGGQGADIHGAPVVKDLGTITEPSTSAMVALVPDTEAAATLALDGGEAQGDLHCTLAFLGKGDLAASTDDIETALADIASAALSGEIGGLGRFDGADNPKGWPLVGLVDAPGINELRERVIDALKGIGVDQASEHSWLPHLTLAFVPPEDEADAASILADGINPVPVRFDALWLVVGTDIREIPLVGRSAPVMKATLRGLAEVDEAKRYTLAPLYPAAPDKVRAVDLDAHDEFVTAADLQESVWGYVRKGDRDLRLQHIDGTVIGECVEIMCMPAPVTVDLSLPGGGVITKSFAAGTPFMGAVWTPFGWDLVQRGEISGFSWGGTAQKMAVELADV